MLKVQVFTVVFLAVMMAYSNSDGLFSAEAASSENPAFQPVEDNPDLPRVLIIGDSISIGYTVPTRERLSEIANVHRIPTNGGPTSNGIAHIDEWLGTGEWDVIHFNWGLHDVKYMEDGVRQVSEEEYEKNLRQLVQRMQKTGAILIWANTTPVPEGNLIPARKPDDEVRYNQIAERIMREHNVRINDLYSFAKACLSQIQLPANVHFTDEGSRILSAAVAHAIMEALAEK
ncbi:MAG: SGNH/GDSL hydrolase family protein [bacterium]|jgi:hypothetical protein